MSFYLATKVLHQFQQQQQQLLDSYREVPALQRLLLDDTLSKKLVQCYLSTRIFIIAIKIVTNVLVQVRTPLSTTYKLSPSSPSQIIRSPYFFFTFCIASSTMLSSFGFKAENINACSRRFCNACFTVSVFSYFGGTNSVFLFQFPKASALTEVLGPLVLFFSII